ncbi:hypothetical protein P9272_19790 [Mesorhizobium sp. WSM4976]|uniref:hypothetical protein n=1 Tax=Mesorhizobium sp. WSM4976 TaxID=3038549 RepID=UPI002417DB6A|nr:hypothetical protein [Mesorhizobium sp. WSM4976]MDG4895815.1 hypothetical protein [Mesorhizobium sp. WSM4976]
MVRGNSAIFVFAAVFVGMTCLLLAWNGLFVPADPTAICTNNMCRAYRVFGEFQTLIAAGIAILAAWLAAQPVWKQLTTMNIQQDIMASEVIKRRLKSIEENDCYLDTKVTAYLQDVWRYIYDWNYEQPEYDPQKIDPQWAHNMEHLAIEILSELGRQQISRADTIKIEVARAQVIARLSDLSECLNSISAPARLAGDPEISAQQEEQLQAAETAARLAFEDVANSVDDSRKAFAQVTHAEIDFIRRRIRDLDQQLIDGRDA